MSYELSECEHGALDNHSSLDSEENFQSDELSWSRVHEPILSVTHRATHLTTSTHLHTRSDNEVRELATECLPWQQWTETSVWFDGVGISAFHSYVVVDLWQSLSEWHLLLSECVFVCRRENVRT
jgi:hypothetical protein